MQIGLVIKVTGNLYNVKTDKGIYKCKIRGKIRLEESKSTNPIVVGDKVEIVSENNADDYVITNILERKNHIVRKATNLSKQTHVIAANIDQAVLIATLINPKTSTMFIDRYLVTCEAYSIKAVIVFNKTDLYTPDLMNHMHDLINTYEKIDYKCLAVSAINNENINALKEVLNNKVSLLSGHSGVGKSTLINIIEPKLKLKTQKISDYHLKGKHTTTFSEMHSLSEGGYIIDTPGIKGFGLVHFKKNELFHFFPEIFKLTEKCQYYNCTHFHEPGCAVKNAVETNEISYSRYENYINLLLEDDNKHR